MSWVLKYALTLIGLPYIYGGQSAITGFDCSGLVTELMRSTGKIPSDKDYSAAGLYQYLRQIGWKRVGIEEAGIGAITFYGKPNKIEHVGFSLGNGVMVEAGGGGPLIKTKEDAIKAGAFVRVRPINYRSDLMAILFEDNKVIQLARN